MGWPWQRQKKQAASEPELQPLSDRKYEQLYRSLLDIQEAAQGDVTAQLQARLGERQQDSRFISWLRRFGQKLLSDPAGHEDLARRMVALAESELGELSVLSGVLGEQIEEGVVVAIRQTENQTKPTKTDSGKVGNVRKDEPELSAERRAAIYWYSGGETFLKGDLIGAIVAYEQAIALKPSFLYSVLNNKGVVLSELGQHEEAIMSYEQALDIKPDCYEALYHKGLALSRLGQHEESIVSYEQALDIKPDGAQALYKKGFALGELGRYEEAIIAFEQALAIEPNLYDALCNKGAALSMLGRQEAAIATYDQALAIKLDYYQGWRGRGIAARQSVQTNSFPSPLAFALQNNALNRRGYEGQIACYTAGLVYVKQESNPEGYGLLYYELGRAHYFQGRFLPDADDYLTQAVSAYQTALAALTAFPSHRLKALQNAIRAYLGLGDLAMVKDCREQGLAIFQQLLNQASTPAHKRRIEQEFSGFSQLQVDSLVRETNPTTALQTAEYHKNRTLGWILNTWKDQIVSPSWDEMRTLLAPETVAIYWHLSPNSLTTFLLTDSAEPEVLSVQPATALETWIKKWNKQYEAYRGKGKAAEENKEFDTWRLNIQASLTELKTILNIPAIEASIQDISQLLLIPHRDLHRLPLHTFFPNHLTAYLPSLQIGLNLKRQPRTASLRDDLSLLNLADPRGESTARLESAEIEATLIGQHFKHADTVPNNQATTQTLTAKLQAPHHIFNFSGHAWAERQPQQSALYLKGDNRLTAEAICKLPLKNYQLITLSACETAVTGLQTIESDYVGLVSAFLTAGAKNIISTLWTVESESNAWLMVRFYQHYVSGDDPAIALKKAQTWLCTLTYADLLQWLNELRGQLSESDNPGAYDALTDRIGDIQSDPSKINSDQLPYADPYYWAAFTITGYLPSNS
ncbi:MAG: CHAT domain-containing tetratricopeptide repeat protein [Cyanobacteria bacterium P01_D01_bin.1]